MCLLTEQLEPKVAEKDIIVYKTVKVNTWTGNVTKRYLFGLFTKTEFRCINTYHSPYYIGHEYKLGEQPEVEMETDPNICFFDMSEAKFFLSKYGKDRDFELPLGTTLLNIGAGYHSCSTMERAVEHSDFYSVFKFIIPKGALYYESGNGLFVSNRIIFTGKRVMPSKYTN